MVLSRRKRKFRHPFHVQFIPNRRQVLTLEELHLVGDHTSAQLLISSVLQIPARLRLLDETPHNRMLISTADHAPDLQVLHGVSVRIFRRTLPGDQVGSERRESQFEDVIGGNSRNDVPDGGVNDGHPSNVNTFSSIRFERRKHTFQEMPMRNTAHMANKKHNGGFPRV